MNYVFFMIVLLINGCSSNKPIQYYMLDAESGPIADSVGLPLDRHLVVGLGPIHLPDYLNRSQIVVELSENQYRLDENHRWAERLDQNISRSLDQLMTSQLSVAQIVRFPWSQRQAIDYQVSIDILAFHQTADGYSLLQAQWQINPQEKTPYSKRFECRIPAKDDIDSIVKAQSACLGRMGMEIVSALRELANH